LGDAFHCRCRLEAPAAMLNQLLIGGLVSLVNFGIHRVMTVLIAAFGNFTALGYGDAVAGQDYRLIGPITSVNGLLLIGWSVVIIFEVMRMAEVQIARKRPS
jgi:hypothetical protein